MRCLVAMKFHLQRMTVFQRSVTQCGITRGNVFPQTRKGRTQKTCDTVGCVVDILNLTEFCNQRSINKN